MLIITRKCGESIIINGNIEVMLYRTEGKYARIGVDAPKNVRVNRKEIEEQYIRQLAEEAQEALVNMKL